MTDHAEHIVPPGLADLPLHMRQARDAEILREQQEAIARRHDAIAADERAYVAGLRAHFLRVAPAIRSALDRLG